jgi:LAO/AO transport system kinase
LELLRPSSKNWSPPVLTCSAINMEGIDEIWQTILDHRKRFEESGELADKRRNQALDWMWALVEDSLKSRFYNNPSVKQALPGIIEAVECQRIAPTAAAHQLLKI